MLTGHPWILFPKNADRAVAHIVCFFETRRSLFSKNLPQKRRPHPQGTAPICWLLMQLVCHADSSQMLQKTNIHTPCQAMFCPLGDWVVRNRTPEIRLNSVVICDPLRAYRQGQHLVESNLRIKAWLT